MRFYTTLSWQPSRTYLDELGIDEFWYHSVLGPFNHQSGRCRFLYHSVLGAFKDLSARVGDKYVLIPICRGALHTLIWALSISIASCRDRETKLLGRIGHRHVFIPLCLRSLQTPIRTSWGSVRFYTTLSWGPSATYLDAANFHRILYQRFSLSTRPRKNQVHLDPTLYRSFSL